MILRKLMVITSRALALAALLPCAGMAQQPERTVRQNELESSALPALRIRVDSAFHFAGTIPFRIRDIASGERYVFVDARAGVVRRLVVAQFEAILATSTERYNYSFANADTIAGYRFRMNPFAFSQAAAASENPNGEAALTAAFLRRKGYQVSDELMSVRYLTVPDSARRHELIVFYMEPLTAAGHRLSDLYSASGQATSVWTALADALAKRARLAFTILPHPRQG